MTRDPEYERWKRKYPRFPGVATCVELLRRGNVRGAWVDIICGELEEHARECTAELLDAIRADANRGIRPILLGVIENAGIPEALPLFVELLDDPDESTRAHAVRGLKRLDTKEARQALWQAGQR